MKVHTIFPTVVLEFDLSELDCTKEVKKILDNYHSREHTLIEKGTSSWNHGNILDLPSLLPLKKCFQDCVDEYVTLLNVAPTYITNSWYNKMYHGGKTVLHRHEGSVVSGAFYPYVSNNSVGLKFHSPLKPYRMNELFKGENNLNTYFHHVPVKNNVLYIFPSWLEHETDINQGDERYTISFNTKVSDNF